MFVYRKARPTARRFVKATHNDKEKNILQRIQDMLKEYEPIIEAALLTLWATEGADITEQMISEALKDNKKVDNISDSYETHLYDFAEDTLIPQMDAVGEQSFKTTYEDNKASIHIPTSQEPPQNITPNDTNQFNYSAFYGQWCDERAGSLIVELNDTQRQNVKGILDSALSQGNINPSSVTRRIKDTVGLTQRQLSRNQKYYDNMRVTLRENNPKLSDKEIEERASAAALRLAEKQRSDRAKSIARTELNTAHNQAAYSYVLWAVEHGYMKNVVRTWVTSGNDNVCPTCFALNGQMTSLYEPYKVPSSVNFKGESIMSPPGHTNCCCGEKFTEGDGTITQLPSQWDKLSEAEKKAHINYHSDKAQYKEYKKRLGKENVPKSLAEFQDLKYNDNRSKEWEDLKYYYRYINGRPIEYVKIDRDLEQQGITNKGRAYPVENIDIKSWRPHSLKQMKASGITQEEALSFKTNAIGMMKKYPAPETQYNYYHDDGVLGVRKRDGQVNTVIGKDRFLNNTETIIEVMKKWLK